MKKLSIIVPVYNVENYLSECIDSIRSSQKNIEILLIDDGSTDNSSIICDEYTKLDDRIKVLHQKNKGVSSARNIGLENATGEYITFVDSDDILSENWDKIIEYIGNDDIYYYTSKAKDRINKSDLLRYITGVNKEHIFLSGVYSKIFKKQIIVDNKIKFKEDLINGEDMLFNVEMALVSKKIRIISFQYYYYRQSIGQATRKYDSRIICSDQLFHKYLYIVLKEHNIDETLANEIIDRCQINAIFLILNRLSYIKKYTAAKKYYEFIIEEPYKTVIEKNSNKYLTFKLCKNRRLLIIYIFMKFKSKYGMILRNIKRRKFIKI